MSRCAANMGHMKVDPVREAAQYTFDSLQRVYSYLNAFAKGETQKEWVRVEPLGMLAQVYGDLAPAFQKLKDALKETP